MIAGGGALLLAVVGLSYSLAAGPGDALTRNTVRLSLAWYTAALLSMLRLGAADWQGLTWPARLARWCWTWAIACFLVHLAMAFHFYHHWSHAHAFARTREVSGVGEGIYVSYFFTWLWMSDCAWWWASPDSYGRRSVWIDRVLHGFMLFIVFNGMLVYETGVIRWAGIVMFAALAAAWGAERGLLRWRHA